MCHVHARTCLRFGPTLGLSKGGFHKPLSDKAFHNLLHAPTTDNGQPRVSSPRIRNQRTGLDPAKQRQLLPGPSPRSFAIRRARHNASVAQVQLGRCLFVSHSPECAGGR